MVGVLLVAVYVVTTVWVGFDARKRDWTATRGPKTVAGHVIGVAILWVVFFPIYLIARRRAPLRATSAAAAGPESP